MTSGGSVCMTPSKGGGQALSSPHSPPHQFAMSTPTKQSADPFMSSTVVSPPNVTVYDDERDNDRYVVKGSEYRELLRVAREHVNMLREVFQRKRTNVPDWSSLYWDCRQGLSLEEAQAMSAVEYRDGISIYNVVSAGHRVPMVNDGKVVVSYNTAEFHNGRQMVLDFDISTISEMYHDANRRVLVIHLLPPANPAGSSPSTTGPCYEVESYNQSVLRSLYYVLLMRHEEYRTTADPVSQATAALEAALPRPLTLPPEQLRSASILQGTQGPPSVVQGYEQSASPLSRQTMAETGGQASPRPSPFLNTISAVNQDPRQRGFTSAPLHHKFAPLSTANLAMQAASAPPFNTAAAATTGISSEWLPSVSPQAQSQQAQSQQAQSQQAQSQLQQAQSQQSLLQQLHSQALSLQQQASQQPSQQGAFASQLLSQQLSHLSQPQEGSRQLTDLSFQPSVATAQPSMRTHAANIPLPPSRCSTAVPQGSSDHQVQRTGSLMTQDVLATHPPPNTPGQLPSESAPIAQQSMLQPSLRTMAANVPLPSSTAQPSRTATHLSVSNFPPPSASQAVSQSSIPGISIHEATVVMNEAVSAMKRTTDGSSVGHLSPQSALHSQSIHSQQQAVPSLRTHAADVPLPTDSFKTEPDRIMSVQPVNQPHHIGSVIPAEELVSAASSVSWAPAPEAT